MKLNKKKIIIILVALLMLILIGATAFFAYFFFFGNADEEVVVRKQDNFNVYVLQHGVEPTQEKIFNGMIEAFKETHKIVNVDFGDADFDLTTSNALFSAAIAPQEPTDDNPDGDPKYDLIITIGNIPAISALTVESTVPIFITGATDPKVIESDDVEIINTEAIIATLPINYSETIDMITALDPDANYIGVLYNANDPISLEDTKAFAAACAPLGVSVKAVPLADPAELSSAFKSLTTVDAVHTLSDPYILRLTRSIAKDTNEFMIPLYAFDNDSVRLGSLASNSIDYTEYGKGVGEMALEILMTGVSSQTKLPSSNDAEIYINKSVADFLDITIPSDYLNNAHLLTVQ